MVSEMQQARRRLDRELVNHNIPDALQVLDKAVSGLIDLAKSRTTDGIKDAKEVQNPFGDPPGIPGAGKARGEMNLEKFAGVYTSQTQDVRDSSNKKKGKKANSQQSTTMPTSMGSMRLGKAMPPQEEDDEEGWDDPDEEGGMGGGQEGMGDGEEGMERFDEDGNPDPEGEYDENGRYIGPPEDDTDEGEFDNLKTSQKNAQNFAEEPDGDEGGPPMGGPPMGGPPMGGPPMGGPGGPPMGGPGGPPMGGPGMPPPEEQVARSFARSRQQKLGNIHKALVDGPNGANVAEVVEASKELAQMVNVFGHFLSDISTQIEAVRAEQYNSTAMLANAVSTVVKSQAAMALGLERIAKSATILASGTVPMQKSLGAMEPMGRPNPGILMNGKVIAEGNNLRRSQAPVDDSGYAMVSAAHVEQRLTKSLVGSVIQQSVVDGEYSPKEALRWLTETDSPTTGPVGVFQQLPPKLRERIMNKVQE
jgi:hypothetical protein